MVVVILGIIAAVAIPAVMGNQATSYKNTNEQNRQIIQEAVQRHAIDNGGTYATAVSSLVSSHLQAIPSAFQTDGTKAASTAWTISSTNGAVGFPPPDPGKFIAQ